MKQSLLNKLWRLNRRAVKFGIPIFGIACSADSFEEVIEVGRWTWHRRTGTLIWLRMIPLAGNLRT
jgi:hypothetical protein